MGVKKFNELFESNIPEGFREDMWKYRVYRLDRIYDDIFKYYQRRNYKPYWFIFDEDGNKVDFVEFDRLKNYSKFTSNNTRYYNSDNSKLYKLYFLTDQEYDKYKDFATTMIEREELLRKQAKTLHEMFDAIVMERKGFENDNEENGEADKEV